MKIDRLKVMHTVVNLLFYVIGSIIFSIGMHVFAVPAHIAPGGVSGLSVAINYLTNIPIGSLSFLINIPLLLLGLAFLGRKFTFNTLVTVLILSASMDIVGVFAPAYTGDSLLAALFSGVLIGTGLALIFLRGSTTGGTDIISRLIQRKYPYMPIGKLLLGIDVIVILFSALVFRKIETVLYSLVAVYISAHTIDSMIYGIERGKLIYIMSSRSDEIADRIIKELDRGCTLLRGEGGYSREKIQVLMVAVRRQQYYTLKEFVHQIDPRAFLIVSDSSEVLGEGFKPIHHH